jgi:hypothetical protein
MRRYCVFLGMVATLWSAQVRAFCQETLQSQWRYDRLNLTVSIVPERGELRILGDGDLELVGESTPDLRLHINGDWYTLKFASVSILGATVEINSTDPKHKAWRIAAAHFAQPLAPGTHLPIRFEIVKDRDAFPLAVKLNAAVSIEGAVWYLRR